MVFFTFFLLQPVGICKGSVIGSPLEKIVSVSCKFFETQVFFNLFWWVFYTGKRNMVYRLAAPAPLSLFSLQVGYSPLARLLQGQVHRMAD